MNVKKRKQAERKYAEEHKEELERTLHEQHLELKQVWEAKNNPELRLWTDKMKRYLKICPTTTWSRDFHQAVSNLRDVYIEKGWMNEKGEWIK